MAITCNFIGFFHVDSLISYRNKIIDKAVKLLPSYAFSDMVWKTSQANKIQYVEKES
jgi:hypothetical protein